MKSSFFFIVAQVCDWVQANGGWQAVLRQGLNIVHQVAMIGMCSAVFVAAVFYIRKNLSTNN